MLGICFFTLGENTPSAPHQEGEKGVDSTTSVKPEPPRSGRIEIGLNYTPLETGLLIDHCLPPPPGLSCPLRTNSAEH